MTDGTKKIVLIQKIKIVSFLCIGSFIALKSAVDEIIHVTHIPADESDTTDGSYGVATISRLLKMIGLFCKRAL